MTHYDFIAVRPLVDFITSTRDMYPADQDWVAGHRDACETFLAYIEALTREADVDVEVADAA